MRPAGEANLVAVRARGRGALDAVVRAWERGDAVAPLDPRAPDEAVAARLAVLRPTHLDAGDGHGPRPLEHGEPVPAGVGAVIPTSGTTGAPRAVQLDHAALAASARAVHAAIGCEPDDAWLCCVPVHHVAGLAIVARAHVQGLPVVVHDGFDVRSVAVSPARDGTTLVSLVATMLTRLLDADAPVDAFRVALLGGGPIPRDVVTRARERGANVATTYGMTETGGGCVHDGHPLPGIEVRIADDGEIQVRGPVVMRGYHRDARATREAFTGDGWLRTGDVGECAPDGTLRVVDRRRDLVITGGVNVSPTAVESVLARHPAVADVCVTGTPDPEWGERVVAHVVPADPHAPPTLDGLRAFARGDLTAPELPRELRIAAAIPRTASGKPQRARLRARP